ncbi:MAG TPA: metallophosphoesterase family protein [Xanthobacteraceae bacterium]|jgi:serine/threonine protein phosphatase 1|nr:metallophosphoesterase family protein [Xanthobacteraceae bacterium]
MSLTFAIGDIHGALHKLQQLLARCEDHADGRPRRYVFLGDYIDRGSDSAGVLRVLRDMAVRLPDVVALMGNHEAMLLAVIDGAVDPENWLGQGGIMTLRSFGVAAVSALPRSDVDWLRTLPLTKDDGRRFFVHAGVDPRLPLDAQDENDLLWIREPFLAAERDYGRLIVHGHTPLSSGAPDWRGNRLNLDTGAAFGGPLTAAVFRDDATPPVTFLQAE